MKEDETVQETTQEELCHGKVCAIMTHQTARMPGVKDPSNRFGQAVGGIDDARNMNQFEIAGLLPILNRKMLNVNVTRASGRATSIDHFDGRLIIFENRSGSNLSETEFTKNGTEILGNFCSFDSSKKLGLGARGGSDCLSVTAIGNNARSKEKTITSSGATVPKIIGMGGIHKTTKLKGRGAWREHR